MDTHSLQATPLFGGYREKWTLERHARGDAKAGDGGEKVAPRGFAAGSLVLAWLGH